SRQGAQAARETRDARVRAQAHVRRDGGPFADGAARDAGARGRRRVSFPLRRTRRRARGDPRLSAPANGRGRSPAFHAEGQSQTKVAPVTTAKTTPSMEYLTALRHGCPHPIASGNTPKP